MLSQTRIVLICISTFILALLAQVLFSEFGKQIIDAVMSMFVSLESCKATEGTGCLVALQKYETAHSIGYYSFIVIAYTFSSFLSFKILGRAKVVSLTSATLLAVGVYSVPFIAAYFASMVGIIAALFYVASMSAGFVLAAYGAKTNEI
ncbi:hypothetical protein ACJJI3_19450 [Microbulbifer sp. ZKSA004]|uniref:hypothetical protein n=1 Tax=Microbulbifer sp. ZKSA004 TaxID=3243389 RepID=UPI0040399463